MKTTIKYLWGFQHKRDVRFTEKTARAKALRARDTYVGLRMPGREGRTRLRINGEDQPALLYTRTDVVTWLKNGWIRLNTNGWNTKTSKARIEEYASISVNSAFNEWWLVDAKGLIHRYKDGMLIKHTEKGIVVKGSKGITLAEFKNVGREYRRTKAKERKRREMERLNPIPQHLRHFNGNAHLARLSFKLISAHERVQE